MEPVLVALVGAGGPVSLVVLHLLNRRELRNRVGDTNSQGTSNDMLGQLLAGQAGQDRRLASLEERMGNVEHQLARRPR